MRSEPDANGAPSTGHADTAAVADFGERVGRRLGALNDAHEIERVGIEALARKLRVDGCAWSECDSASAPVVSTSYWLDPEVDDAHASFSMADFGAALMPDYRAGRTVRIENVRTDPRLTDAERRAHRDAGGLLARLTVPLTRDGEVRAYLCAYATVPRAWSDADAALARVAAGRIWDGLARARAEARTRDAEELLGFGVRAAGIGLFTIDLATRRLRLSHEAAVLLGAVRPDAEPVPFETDLDAPLAAMHPDDVPAARAALQAAIDPDGDGAYRLEHRLLRPDGTVCWSSLLGHAKFEERDGVRRAVRVTGATLDVTDSKRLQEELVAREAGLRDEVVDRTHELEAMLDAAVSAIVTIDATGTVRSVNAATATIFGHAREALIGRNVNVLMPEEHRRHHDGYLSAYMTTGRARIIGIGRELEGRRADGTTFPMHLSVGEFTADGQRLFTGIIHDLSERNRAEQALRQAQKMEAVGQLSGGIAHDFNNLLTVIGGNLELLDLQLDAGAREQRDLLHEARDAMQRGAALTARLLAFSRREPLAPVVVRPTRLVPELMDLLRRTLGESITVHTTVAPHSHAVRVDKSQFENAIVNLSINARDAMPGGGTLVLDVGNAHVERARGAPHPELADGDYLRVSVVDEGHGMAPEVVARAFEPFYTTKEPGRGTGLGLPMVFGFVRRSGGQVVVRSEPGTGTRFDLYLPRHVGGADAPTADGVAPRGREITGVTVLVIEDEPQVRRLTCQRLRLLGHDVIEAAAGAEGLALLEARPDVRLVVSDIVMPGGLDGHDIACEVRRRRPGVAVLLTSGYAKPSDGTIELPAEARSDAVPVLSKPYDQTTLASAVAAALDGARRS